MTFNPSNSEDASSQFPALTFMQRLLTGKMRVKVEEEQEAKSNESE